MKKIIFFIFFTVQFFTSNFVQAQDSSHLKISLITCSSGAELYSLFGHSAIRVKDSTSLTDYIYNYGNFPFNDKNFYIKFIKGKLKYSVDVESFDDFVTDYTYDKRGIVEQELILSANDKISIQHFLNENIKTQNKYYYYDFFFDNCTTRIKDILKPKLANAFCINPTMQQGTTFRNAIHFYLNKNHHPWSKLGIDILLGKPCDAVMTTEQMLFLPNNLMQSFDSCKPNLIKTHQNILAAPLTKTNFNIPPAITFICLLLFIILASFSHNNFVKKVLYYFDFTLFFILGLLGILLIFMWTATNHALCKNNFNLLWAIPTHFVASFFINSNKKWVLLYCKITSIFMLLILLFFGVLPQQLNVALIPILLLIFYRSFVKGFLK